MKGDITMSNWSRAKINFKNITTDLLAEALKAMGYEADFKEKSVKGAFYAEGSRNCDCVLHDIDTGKSANIGLKFEQGENEDVVVSVVGDWYDKSYNDRTFTQALTLEYTTAKMSQQARLHGYIVESVEMTGEYERTIVYAKAA